MNVDKLLCEKHIKSDIDCHTFSIYRYDNMFSPISSGDNFFGLVEIYKENGFASTDVEIFRTIIQQVSMPLKNASLYQEIIETTANRIIDIVDENTVVDKLMTYSEYVESMK